MQIAVDRQCKLDTVQPGTAALYHCKHDTLKYTLCTLSELRRAASVAAGGEDEMTRDVVHQQPDMGSSFVHAGPSHDVRFIGVV